MKISQLPKEVKEKALEYQKNANKDWNKTTDYLGHAFDWDHTIEREDYWNDWEDKEWQEKEYKVEETKTTKTQIYTI
jgi:hypothetical protein